MFSWGDTVKFKSATTLAERSGQFAEVCGVVRIDTTQHAQGVLGGAVGQLAYLIEFSDGHSQEVTDVFLEATEP